MPVILEVLDELLLLVFRNRRRTTTGMLLCLDRRQRLVFTLGEIFGASASAVPDRKNGPRGVRDDVRPGGA